MARIAIPEGAGSETERVWTLSPELGAAVGGLAGKVGGKGLSLPWRVREAARMKHRADQRLQHLHEVGESRRSPATESPRSSTRTSTIRRTRSTTRRSSLRSSTRRSSRSITGRSTTRSSPA